MVKLKISKKKKKKKQSYCKSKMGFHFFNVQNYEIIEKNFFFFFYYQTVLHRKKKRLYRIVIRICQRQQKFNIL